MSNANRFSAKRSRSEWSSRPDPATASDHTLITRGASVGVIGQKRATCIYLESVAYDWFGLLRAGRNGFDSVDATMFSWRAFSGTQQLSWLERRFHTAEVADSNSAAATILLIFRFSAGWVIYIFPGREFVSP